MPKAKWTWPVTFRVMTGSPGHPLVTSKRPRLNGAFYRWPQRREVAIVIEHLCDYLDEPRPPLL
ncbi:MAG: hypothetical protein ACUVX1_05830 [Chloroflexota bacterium]